MQYLISFLEGIVTFLSPGLLTLLPVYALWCFDGKLRDNKGSLRRTFGFALGFGAAYLAAAAAHLRVPGLICGGILLALGLLRITTLEGRLPKPLPGLLCGMTVALCWTGNHGFFPDALTTQGSILLVCYALGAMVPLLFGGVFLDRLKGAIPWVGDHKRETEMLSGGLLLAAGIIMMF